MPLENKITDKMISIKFPVVRDWTGSPLHFKLHFSCIYVNETSDTICDDITFPVSSKSFILYYERKQGNT